MPRKAHLDGLAIALLLGCCLVWGFQQVLAKATIPEVAPIFQAALRVVGATVLLFVWCRVRRIPLFASDGSLGAGLLAGALFTAEFGLIFSALASSSASRATLLLYTSPFWVACVLPLIVKSERLRPAQWLGLLLAFAAVAFVLQDSATSVASGRSQWHGDLLALAAGLSWGLTTVAIRATRLMEVSAEKLLFYQLGVGAIALPVLSLVLGETWNWHWSAFAQVSLALQTVVGAFASYLVWMWMLGRYPATHISSFVFFTPVFAMLFGALWLKEAVTPNLLAGMALVAAGMVLVNRRPAA
ncbi:MAG: DMT family transporter [Burkholderiaceae bacterium]